MKWSEITEAAMLREASSKDVLYSATSHAKLPSILQSGMRPPSYWTPHYELVDYYADTVRDEGDQPVILAVSLDRFDAGSFAPDMPSIEEPINSFVRSLHGFGSRLIPDPYDPDEHLDIEEWVLKSWEHSAQDYKASLDIVGSVVYRKPLKIMPEDADEMV